MADPWQKYQTNVGPWEKYGAPSAAATASTIYRPILEAGASALGGLAGTPGGPALMVAGGTLGYAAGDKAADIIEQLTGVQQPKGVKGEFLDTGQALKEGAMWEMAGASAGQMLQAAVKGGQVVFQKIKDLLPEQQAGQQLVAKTGYSTIYAKNAEEAAEIEKRIPGLKFSAGQRTNDPELIKLERSLARGSEPGAGRAFVEQRASNNESIRNYYQQNFAGENGIEDVLSALSNTRSGNAMQADNANSLLKGAIEGIPQQPPQAIGQDVLSIINRAKEPVKQGMNTLESQIPDYPMQFNGVKKSISTALKNKKLSAGQREAITSFSKKYNGIVKDSGSSTYTAMGLNRTLNDEISKRFAMGDDSAASILLSIKEGLDNDIAEVGRMARSGKIVVSNGKPVSADALAKELETNMQRSALLKGRQTINAPAMISELTEKGYPAYQVVGESAESYSKRLQADYKKYIGKQPILGTSKEALEEVSQLDARNAEIKNILQNSSPGQDVGAAMGAYNQFASEQWFNRFDKGAIQQAAAKGQQSGGTRTRLENIPSLFMTPSGADDLIRAVGKEDASQTMLNYAGYDLMQNATNPATGEIVPKKLYDWVAKNKSIAMKYGWDFSKVSSAQNAVDLAQETAKEFEKSVAAKMLNADPDKAMSVAFSGKPKETAKNASRLVGKMQGNSEALNGLRKSFADFVISKVETAAKDISGGNIISQAQFQKIMKQYGPAMNIIYKDKPDQLKALVNMQKAYEVASRNLSSPLGGGSDTAENVAAMLTRKFVPGKIMKVLGPAADIFKGYSEKMTNTYLTRALFDPEYAQTLMAIRSKRNPVLVPSFRGQMIDIQKVLAGNKGQVAASTGVAAQSMLGQEPENNR